MSTPPSAESDSILAGGNPIQFSNANPLGLFIIQIVLVVVMTRLVYIPLRYLKQPRVIAEIVSGIILGPTALSRIPAFKNHVFPAESLPMLNLIANLGLVFFLFIVGLEIDARIVAKNWKKTLSTSLCGMMVDFCIAVGVAFVLFGFSQGHGGFAVFYLFIAISMSITALPVLARILSEIKLLRSPVGILAISAAAVDDVASCCLLALVVSLAKAESSFIALWITLTALGYSIVAVIFLRWAFQRLMAAEKHLDEQGPSQRLVLFTLVMVLLNAWFTSVLGVHAIFGAFLVGLVTPHTSGFAVKISEKLEDLVGLIFLPMYFALSGLKTEIGLLSDIQSWGLVALVTVCAICGKVAGCATACRLNGLRWRESFAVGSLMTCKGLVELIVLNMGLEAGVLDRKMFAILVAMAILTTVLTTPLIRLVYPDRYREQMSKLDLQKAETLAPGLDTLIGHVSRQFVVVLRRLNEIPSVMHVLKLFAPVDVHEIQVRVVRLMAVEDSSSSIIRHANADQNIGVDTMAGILETFAHINELCLTYTFKMGHATEFYEIVRDFVYVDSAEICLIPWTIPTDDLNALKQEISSSSSAQYVGKLYEHVKDSLVLVMVDRGIAGGCQSERREYEIRTSIDSLGCCKPKTSVLVLYTGAIDKVCLHVGRLFKHNNVPVQVINLTSKSSSEDEVQEGCHLPVMHLGENGDWLSHAQNLKRWDFIVMSRGTASSSCVLGALAAKAIESKCKASLLVIKDTTTMEGTALRRTKSVFTTD